jgi:hypothetical protein
MCSSLPYVRLGGFQKVEGEEDGRRQRDRQHCARVESAGLPASGLHPAASRTDGVGYQHVAAALDALGRLELHGDSPL